MVSPTQQQLNDERYPDTTIPSVLPLPNTPSTPEETVSYIRVLHSVLAQNQARLAEVMRVLAYHRNSVSVSDEEDSGVGGGGASGGTDDMPPATESNVQHVDYNPITGQARMFVDGHDASGDPLWYEVAKAASGSAAEAVGLENAADVTLTFSDVTGKLTVAPTGTGFYFWVDGVRFYKDSPEEIQMSLSQGVEHVYYDNTGTLQKSTAVTINDLIFDNAYVANVYWDATNMKSVFVGDERHGLMDPNVHYWIHVYGGGTKYGSGMTIGDIISDATGALDTHAEMSVSGGTFIDEDLLHTVDAKAAPAQIPVMYKVGSTPDWEMTTAGNAPIKFSAGVPQVNTYDPTAGTWGQTAVTNNKFFLMHIFATNDITQAKKIVAIQGEAEYSTVSDARSGAIQEISDILTAGLPMAEWVALGTIIYEYKTAYTNSYDCRIRTTAAGDDYVNWLTEELSPGASPGAHSNTTGRSNPSQHPATAIDFGSTYPISDDVYMDSLYLGTTTGEGIYMHNGTTWANFAAYSPTGYFQMGAAATTEQLSMQFKRLQGIWAWYNALELEWWDTGYANKYGALYMDSSNRFRMSFDQPTYFGDVPGGDYTIIGTTGTILQVGDAYIDTQTYVRADDAFYGKAHYSEKTKTMANNTSQNFFKWGTGASAGDCMGYRIDFRLKVQYEILGTTYYWTRAGYIEGNMLFNGTYVWANSASGVQWKGAAIDRNAAGSAGSATMNENVVQGSGGGVSTLGPYFLVNLGGGRTYISGECTYWVTAEGDVDDSYMTLF